MTVTPILRPREEKSPVLGFDTEYTSKGAELISFQLADAERGAFIKTSRLTVDTLARECLKLVPHGTTNVILAAYWAIAELQHLPVIEEALEVKTFGASIDVVFYSRKYALTLRTFDLARFFDRKPLQAVAESYGLSKVEGIDRTRVTKRDADRKAFREYAINDARLCYQISERLREGFAPDSTDPLYEGSPASTAAAVFRRGLRKRLDPPAARHRLMGMLACWGGRAEALTRGPFSKAYEYDLASAYPRAAWSFGVLPARGDWKSVKRTRDVARYLGGLGRFRFRFPPETRFPCLPVATKKLQIYPLQGETWCSFDEIGEALKMGASVTTVEAFGFNGGRSDLCDYMKRVLGERDSSEDPVRRTALKLLANSLIGKLAQRVVGPEMDALLELARSRGIELERFVRLTAAECDALGVPIVVRLGSAFFPEWNALITGRVRAIMGAAVAESDALYVSTDAVWTRTKRPPTPILGARWTLARQGSGVVVRTRLARIGTHSALHSVWNRAAGAELLEGFASEGSADVSYKIRRPLKLKEAIAKGSRYGLWIEEERTASAHWDGKRRLADGSRTEPWSSVGEYAEAAKAD